MVSTPDMLSVFLSRNEIKQLTLDLEVLQQVNSFDVEMNASCHGDDRNKVLIFYVLCLAMWVATSKRGKASCQTIYGI